MQGRVVRYDRSEQRIKRFGGPAHVILGRPVAATGCEAARIDDEVLHERMAGKT